MWWSLQYCSFCSGWLWFHLYHVNFRFVLFYGKECHGDLDCDCVDFVIDFGWVYIFTRLILQVVKHGKSYIFFYIYIKWFTLIIWSCIVKILVSLVLRTYPRGRGRWISLSSRPPWFKVMHYWFNFCCCCCILETLEILNIFISLS